MKFAIFQTHTVLLLLLLGLTRTTHAEEVKFSFQTPSIAQFGLTGMPNLDQAGSKQGNTLYPAPNAGIALVGVLTHAFITEKVRNSEKERIQKQANDSLASYQPIIRAMAPQEIFQNAIAQLNTNVQLNIQLDNPQAPVRLISTSPEFDIQMTPDQRALVVSSQIKVQTKQSEQIYTLQTTSPPCPEDQTPSEFWTNNQGENLKKELSRMFAQTLHSVTQVHQISDNDLPAQKTHRYKEGNKERMQRGQLLVEQCNYITIKNLSGLILNLPKISVDHQCSVTL